MSVLKTFLISFIEKKQFLNTKRKKRKKNNLNHFLKRKYLKLCL